MNGESVRAAQRRVGTTLGKYRLTAVLGIGGMASVHAAAHRNGHRVAIKTLLPELATDDDLRARFVREAYTANAIEHPGVVRVLDDDVAPDGSVYLVMELLEGETLRERWEHESRALPASEVVALARQLLAVLEVAHAAGVVHRDIKPDNLFLTTDGVLKVLDFGIARAPTAHAEATLTGRAMGTPAYMPPEQALAHTDEIDARTDLWAVAATMYTLLTGRFVHDTENAAELVVAAATRPARSVALLRSDLDPALVATIDRGLAFAREDRWASATAMLEALADVVVVASATPRGRNRLAVASAPTLDIPVDIDETATASDDQLRASFEPTRASPGAAVAQRIRGTAAGPRVEVRTLRSGGDPSSTADSESAPDARSPTPTTIAAPIAPRNERIRSRSGLGALGALCVAAGVFVWYGALWRPEEAPAPAVTPSPKVSASAVAPACASHAMCTSSLGEAALCLGATCRKLASEDCRVTAEPDDLADPATIWIGAMYSHEDSRRAVELARRDFHDVASGLPPARPGGPRRPIGVVACDDRADPMRVARHLVDDIEVPAVLGFSLSKEALDLTNAIFQPRGVLALAGNQSTMLSNVPRPPGAPRMLFRVSPSARQFAQAMMAVVRDVWEPELRAEGPLRVALARVPNTTGMSYADVFLSEMKIGGVAIAADPARFRQVITPLDEADAAARAQAVREVVEMRPHVIVASGGDLWLVEGVERAWPADARFRPRWVELGMLAKGHAALVAARPDLRARILGVDTVTSHPALAKYVVRYRESHDAVPPLDVGAFPYDAFYAFAYLATAIGDRPLTGPELAAAWPRLARGTPIDVGRGGIFAVFDALARGGTVDLVGTTTSLDVDLDSGDSPAPMAAYCLASSPGGGPPRPIESGLVFSSADGHMDGEKTCP